MPVCFLRLQRKVTQEELTVKNEHLSAATFLTITEHCHTTSDSFRANSACEEKRMLLHLHPSTVATSSVCTELCRETPFGCSECHIPPVGHTQPPGNHFVVQEMPHGVVFFACTHEYLGALITALVTISHSIQRIIPPKWKRSGQHGMTEWLAATTKHGAHKQEE